MSRLALLPPLIGHLLLHIYTVWISAGAGSHKCCKCNRTGFLLLLFDCVVLRSMELARTMAHKIFHSLSIAGVDVIELKCFSIIHFLTILCVCVFV